VLALERRSGEVWKLLSAVRSEFGKYNKSSSALLDVSSDDLPTDNGANDYPSEIEQTDPFTPAN
jgi:hypothetical protein